MSEIREEKSSLYITDIGEQRLVFNTHPNLNFRRPLSCAVIFHFAPKTSKYYTISQFYIFQKKKRREIVFGYINWQRSFCKSEILLKKTTSDLIEVSLFLSVRIYISVLVLVKSIPKL